MNKQILSACDLKEITGYKREGPLKEALVRQGIPVFEGKNGIWTTSELITRAGLAKMGILNPTEQEIEWLP